MQYTLQDKLIFNGQESVIQTYGDALWDELTYKVRGGEKFTIEELIGKLEPIDHLAPTTQRQIIRAVLFNVLGEYKDNPQDCPVQRPSKQIWRIA